jgi:hypothetical protein
VEHIVEVGGRRQLQLICDTADALQNLERPKELGPELAVPLNQQ